MNIHFRPQTPEEEFEYVWSLVEDWDFYQKNGYVVSFPDHPTFKNLVDKQSKPQLTKQGARHLFCSTIYDLESYRTSVSVLETYRSQVESVFPQFEIWHRLWNFRVFENYEIVLSLYGPEGSYDVQKGQIQLKTYPNGTFVTSPGETIIHEMVHMGIEECIVDTFNLAHWVKERIVDLICSTAFHELLPNYSLQPIEDTSVDTYITPDTLLDLPAAIQCYSHEQA